MPFLTPYLFLQDDDSFFFLMWPLYQVIITLVTVTANQEVLTVCTLTRDFDR